MFDESVVSRFWKKVQKQDACWVWTAYGFKGGYGQFQVGTKRPGKLMLAHRVSWIIANGPIPEGIEVLHSCDNPSCVNPDHLLLGTHADNMADMAKKLRQDHKLTPDQVIAIREAPGKYREIAKEFGVCHAWVSRVKRGMWWRQL